MQQATAAWMWQSGGRAIRLQEQSNSNNCNRGGQRTDRSRSRNTPRTSNPRQHSSSLDQSRTQSRGPSPYSNENEYAQSTELAQTPTKQSGVTCFNCGKSGHLAGSCNTDPKSVRRCYGCNGVGHLARVCPNRESKTDDCSSKLSSSNAVASAGNGAPQVLVNAVLNSTIIHGVLIDSGSAFSMVSAATYDRLERKPSIQPFVDLTPDIICVGGARPEVNRYVDVPLRLADVDVVHPLLVVSNLAFPLLVGTDILRPYAATLSIEKNCTIRFKYSSSKFAQRSASMQARSLEVSSSWLAQSTFTRSERVRLQSCECERLERVLTALPSPSNRSWTSQTTTDTAQSLQSAPQYTTSVVLPS